jgi:SAM-dependent MidA family methyltransferase
MPATLPTPSTEAAQHSARLCAFIRGDITAQGGWISFARFMELALYAPGLGYYAAGARKLGAEGDFVTAPEISPLFGRTLAWQAVEIMAQSAPQILELGAGSGKLAADLLAELEQLNCLPERYRIIEVSPDLRERQQALLRERLPHLLNRVQWLDALPETISGTVIANEVLDALPVHLVRWYALDVGRDLSRHGGEVGINPDLQNREHIIYERGVSIDSGSFIWQNRPIEDPALLQIARGISVPDGYLSEISLAARGLVASLCERVQQGVLLLVDYGFGAGEYYHPQRAQGTLMCHYRHHAHDDPFFLPGLQDITAHLDFSAVAESALASGAQLLGYTTQAHFLINCGIADFLAEADPENLRDYLPLSAQLQKLTSPAEMGELFKVMALGKSVNGMLRGFAAGDKSRLL